MIKTSSLLCLIVFLFGNSVPLRAGVHYPAPLPGAASAAAHDGRFVLSNSLLEAAYAYDKGKLSFDGLKSGKAVVAEGGGELFILKTVDGKEYPSSQMTLEKTPRIVSLPADETSWKGADKVPGKALEAIFLSPDGLFRVAWRAVLRDDSHYLRAWMSISSSKDAGMGGIIAMQYRMMPDEQTGEGLSVSGNTRGSLLVTPMAFAALETPMAKNTIAGGSTETASSWNPFSWNKGSWLPAGADVPDSLAGVGNRHLVIYQGEVKCSGSGDCRVTFTWQSGPFRLNTVGARLIGQDGKTVSQDIHPGATGWKYENNTYVLRIPAPGNYRLQFWAETKTEKLDSSGSITYSLPVTKVRSVNAPLKSSMAQGLWDRKETLHKGTPWQVSSVLGLFVPGQERRSFLAYLERERPVPYRPMVHYNSWFELNVHTSNNADPLKRMVEKQCLQVIRVWHEKLFKAHGVQLDAFVWDDGWDDFNSLWAFHKGFPAGFSSISREAGRQKAGIGAWLGPVGGYYQSKDMRLAHWNKTHPDHQVRNFKLSNDEYYQAFKGRCVQMIKDYDMRYFKLDGISTRPTTKGPDENNEEDAEGILRLVSELRQARPDVFINCTVGTWASPFWFLYADSIWRQASDWSQSGQGNKREKWITYRDQVVWDSFVKSSPLCPINSLMFHGLIVTRHGIPSAMPNDNLKSIRNEMRCAFASGSGVQELYLDHDIITGLDNGILWDDLARSIRWYRSNTDVLSDTHWVGGSPAGGSIYGWASWKPGKAVFALRNPSSSKRQISLSLRQILDLPRDVGTPFVFTNVYEDQRLLDGFTGMKLSPDTAVTFELEPFEVMVFESQQALEN